MTRPHKNTFFTSIKKREFFSECLVSFANMAAEDNVDPCQFEKDRMTMLLQDMGKEIRMGVELDPPAICEYLSDALKDNPVFINFDGGFLGSSVLHNVCRYDRTGKVVEQVIEDFDPIVDQQDAKLRTPLHWAVEYNNPAAISVLMNHGADPSLNNANQRTPSDLACYLVNIDCLRALSPLPKTKAATKKPAVIDVLGRTE